MVRLHICRDGLSRTSSGALAPLQLSHVRVASCGFENRELRSELSAQHSASTGQHLVITQLLSMQAAAFALQYMVDFVYLLLRPRTDV